MRLYADYLSFLRKHNLLEATLVRQLQPWTCNFLCHLFDTCEAIPQSILEIGRSAGHSYGLLRWLCPSAVIVSIDPHPKKPAVAVAELMKGTYRFTDKTSDQAFADGDVSGPIDFVLIDGDHSEAAVQRDWDNVQGVLSPKAMVLFDNLDHSKGCGKAFQRIPEGGGVRKVLLCPPEVWPPAWKGTAGLVIVDAVAHLR